MKNFQPTAQLVADLEIVAAIMEKHNLDFDVDIDGDTHGLLTEFHINVGRTGYKVNDYTYMTAEGLRLTVAMLREQVQRNLEAVDTEDVEMVIERQLAAARIAVREELFPGKSVGVFPRYSCNPVMLNGQPVVMQTVPNSNGRNYVKFFSQDGVLLAPPHHSEVLHRGLKFLLEFEEFSCGFGHYLKWYGQWAGE